MVLFTSIALASPPLREQVSFDDGLVVIGFPPVSDTPGCGVHFEHEDPALGWMHYRFGLSGPDDLEEGPYSFVPPHAGRTASGAMWASPWFRVGTDRWRIVNADGTEVTAFNGAYAVDAFALAHALGVEETYWQAKAKSECVSVDGYECWTALELWLYLEDWQDRHCVVE